MGQSRQMLQPVYLWTATWILATGSALAVFHRSMMTPGESLAAPVSIEPASHPQAFFFAHPHCGCTTKTIAELSLIAEQSDALITIVITGPAADVPDWRESTNARESNTHPKLRIIHDPTGRLAERYGAQTSGHTVVYDGQGQLLFSGGLTPARGMSTPSAGLDALRDACQGRRPNITTSAVFGCGIFRCQSQEEAQ